MLLELVGQSKVLKFMLKARIRQLWEELFANGKDLNVRPAVQPDRKNQSGLLSYGSDMTIQNSAVLADFFDANSFSHLKI